jgi:hypothetical protein
MSAPSPDSPWFLLWFVLLWTILSVLLAFFSGWVSLSRRFRSDVKHEGKNFRWISGSMGWRWFPVGYRSCLSVTVTNSGVGLSVIFLFRLLCPPLFIPWSAVTAVRSGRFLFRPYAALDISGAWSEIRVYGKAAHCMLEYAPAKINETAP